MKRIITIAVYSISAAALFYCASIPGGGKPPKGRIGVVKCENNVPVLYRYNKESGEVIEKGPVLLPEGETCKKAASKEEKILLKMQRDGEWEKYYSGTKSVLERGSYRLSKKEGIFKYYTKSGELSKTVTYKAGEKDGEEISYFPGTDDWREKGANSNNEKSGPWQKRLAANAECIEEGNYAKGEKSGPWTECSQDSKTKKAYLSFKGSYQSDLKNNASVTYNSEGIKTGEGQYRADIACKNDPGQPDKTKCEKKSGRWVYYHSNGNKSEEGSYSAQTGKKNGNWTEYYRSGEKMGTGSREHTRRGSWTFYNKDGSILGRYVFEGTDNSITAGDVYEKGRKIQESLPAKNCKKIVNRLGREVTECENEAGGFGAALLNYDADSDSLKVTLKMQRGAWALYNEQGQKIGEGSFLNGRKDGTWKELEGGRWVTKNYMMGKLK